MSLFAGLKRVLLGGRLPQVSRDAGAYRGTLKGWRVPRTYTRSGENAERALTQGRAADLYVNDWAARSVVNTIATSSIGSGLIPQARLPWQRLGIAREAARALESEFEWLWAEWSRTAQANGPLQFGDLQLLGFRSILRDGEMLHVPAMTTPGQGRRFGLVIQPVSPSRLATPADKIDDRTLRDGIEIDDTGAPRAYWLATPRPSAGLDEDISTLVSGAFTRVPAHIGHRPGCFHLFFNEREEQTRGISILSPGIKLFRHLADAINHELFGQVAAASVPMVVETGKDSAQLPPWAKEETRPDGQGGEEKVYYESIEAGTLLYLNEGETLKALESSRPSPNFLSFCELVIRALAASADLPYEAVMKDFSKTNYSSARASMLEAWRVYLMYRAWFARLYCQPVWEMVLEEAYLRGFFQLPAGSPDFYEAMHLWCNATWIGPGRGYVDPTKEVQANIDANAAALKTRKEILAEQGLDFEEVMDDLEEEAMRMKQYRDLLGAAAKAPAQPEAPEEPAGDDDEPV